MKVVADNDGCPMIIFVSKEEMERVTTRLKDGDKAMIERIRKAQKKLRKKRLIW